MISAWIPTQEENIISEAVKAKVLRGGMVPALVDGVLKVHCLLRREQRYEEAQYTMIIVLL